MPRTYHISPLKRRALLQRASPIFYGFWDFWDCGTDILLLLLIEWATKSGSVVIERGLLYSSIYSAGESARELREGYAILSVIMRSPLARTLK